MVLLSKLEEVLVLGGERFELSANLYSDVFQHFDVIQHSDVIHPKGYEYLWSFRLDPFPVFEYRCGNVELEKTVFLVHGENTVVVRYELRGDLRGRSCTLEVRPLIAFRDYHSTTHANDAIRRGITERAGMAVITPYPSLPSLYVAHNAESIDTAGFWFYNFEYARERERGLDSLEDLYSPFLLRFDLAASSPAAIVASTSPREWGQASELQESEIRRRSRIVQMSPAQDVFATTLVCAAD